MDASSFIRYAESAPLDGPTALRPEDNLDFRALLRLELLDEAGCEDVAGYRSVLMALARGKAILLRRREELAAAEALAGGQR